MTSIESSHEAAIVRWRKRYHSDKSKVLDRQDIKTRRAAIVRPRHLNQEIWNEAFGVGGLHLDDNWARIYTINSLGVLYVYKRVRLEEAWLEPLVKDCKNFKDICSWPVNQKGTNKWKEPFFSRFVVAAAIRDKESGQLKVTFPGKAGVTYYFYEECNAARSMPGWLIPRRQSLAIPWKRGGVSIKQKKPHRMWVPELTNEERDILLTRGMQGKTHVIRRLRMRHKQDIEDRKMTIMDVKEGVERLLKAVGLN